MALTTTQVSQLYVALFGRASEGSGNKAWADLDLSLAETASLMLETPAAQEYFGGELTNEEFITFIYANTLGFTTDLDGIAAWTKFLDDGMSRGEVAALMIETVLLPENAGTAPQQQFLNRVEVSDYMAANVETVATEDIALTQFTSPANPSGALNVTDDKSTVSSAESAIDEMSGGAVIDGETFSLTADSPKNIILTAKNDLVEAGKFLEGKTILDQGGIDKLNATLSSAITTATTIQGVEKINLDWDAFTTATVAADNITAEKDKETTITISSAKLGFNGKASVTGTAANNVTAGTNVTDLTIAGLTTGKVNTGNAEKASVTTAAVDDTANVKVNGDIDLTIGTATKTIITAPKDAVVNLTGALTDVEVVGENVTLKLTAALGTTPVIKGAATILVEATGLDLSKAEGNIVVDADIAALTVANNADVTLNKTNASLTITGTSATNGAVTVNTAVDQTSLTFATVKTATINVSDDVTIATLVAGTSDVVITGKGDVTVTAGTAASFDASALEGELKYTQTAAADTDVVGSAGDNTVVLKGTTHDNTFTGQDGDDDVTFATTAGGATAVFTAGTNEVTATSLTTGTLSVTGGTGSDTVVVSSSGAATIAANLGAGDDVLDITAGVHATSTVVVDFGAGNDTLKINTDITTNTFTFVNLNNIDIGDGAGAVVAGKFVSGQSYKIVGEGAGTTLVVEATVVTGETIDLSKLTFDGTVSYAVTDLQVTGSAKADTITLSAAKDLVMVEDVTSTGIDKIVGFNANYDKINTTGDNTDTTVTLGLSDKGTFAKGTGSGEYADLTAVLATFASGQANATLVLNSYTFKFDDKDYLLIDNGTAGYSAVDDTVIELSGVVGTLTAANIIND